LPVALRLSHFESFISKSSFFFAFARVDVCGDASDLGTTFGRCDLVSVDVLKLIHQFADVWSIQQGAALGVRGAGEHHLRL